MNFDLCCQPIISVWGTGAVESTSYIWSRKKPLGGSTRSWHCLTLVLSFIAQGDTVLKHVLIC